MYGPKLPNFANATETINITVFDYIAEVVTKELNIYYTPLLVLLGIIGNFMSIYVFYNSQLRVKSTSKYLSVLAISDTVGLLQLLPPWLNAVQITDIFHRQVFCQIFIYVTYVTSSLSAWLVLAFTVERFVAVVYPLKRNYICTIKRARVIIGTITAITLLLNLPLIRLAVAKKDDCSIDSEYLDYASRFNMMDMMVAFIIPVVIIIILNATIMYGVYKLDKTRDEMIRSDALQLGARFAKVQHCDRPQHKVTRMLLLVSSVFVILNVPAYSMRLIAYALNMEKNQDVTRSWAALQQVAMLLFNTNFGINFFLYCVSGKNFRLALRQTIRRPVLIRGARRPIHGRPNSNSNTLTEGTALPATRRGTFISKWTYDNSQQRLSAEEIEMRSFSPTLPAPRSRWRIFW